MQSTNLVSQFSQYWGAASFMACTDEYLVTSTFMSGFELKRFNDGESITFDLASESPTGCAFISDTAMCAATSERLYLFSLDGSQLSCICLSIRTTEICFSPTTNCLVMRNFGEGIYKMDLETEKLKPFIKGESLMWPGHGTCIESNLIYSCVNVGEFSGYIFIWNEEGQRIRSWRIPCGQGIWREIQMEISKALQIW